MDKKKVYDLKNCGPRNRFTVRGGPGCEPMIVHNCAQGIAREILVQAMLNAESTGKYDIRMSTYDEVVALVDDKEENTIEDFDSLLSQTPTWAAGLPIVAEGFETHRYKKD